MFNLDRDGIAIIEKKGYSYKELKEFSQKLKLKRDLVVFLTNSSFESIAGYVSFLNNKIPALLLPFNIDATLLQNILDKYRPKYIYAPIDFEYKTVIEFENYKLFETNYKIDYQIADNLALLISTSGSTGSIKFVKQSYENIYENTLSIIKYLNITNNDRAITTLPMSYTFMLSILNTHLFVGGSVVATNYSILEKGFWEVLKKEKVTTFSGVPFTFEMLKKLKFEKLDLGDIKYITQAGGKLSNDLVKYFVKECEKKGIKFIVMYGQTEATARISYLPWEDRDKIGSIGKAIPNGKMWLENENGKIIEEPFKEGELIYSGKNVTMGYSMNCYDLSSGETKGVLRTGDIAMFDNNRFFYITGRVKRFVKIYGNRINLDELEKLAKSYNVVISGDDKKINIYSLNDNKEVVSFLAKKIKQNKNIFRFKKVDKFIRNEAGKILYKKMDEKHGD